MPQGDIEPRRLTDDTTFEQRHPEAPSLPADAPAGKEWWEQGPAIRFAIDDPEPHVFVRAGTTPDDLKHAREDIAALAAGNDALRAELTSSLGRALDFLSPEDHYAIVQINVTGDMLLPATDASPGRFGFVPDAPDVHEADTPVEQVEVATGDGEVRSVTTESTADAAVTAKELLEAKATAERAKRIAVDAAEERHLANQKLKNANNKLVAIQDGDGLDRSPLLEDPAWYQVDPSVRGYAIAGTGAALTIFAGVTGIVIAPELKEAILTLVLIIIAISATTGAAAVKSVRDEAYTPVSTAKIVDKAYRAGQSGAPRPLVR